MTSKGTAFRTRQLATGKVSGEISPRSRARGDCPKGMVGTNEVRVRQSQVVLKSEHKGPSTTTTLYWNGIPEIYGILSIA